MKYSVIILLEEKNEDFSQFVRMLHDTFSTRQDPFEILIVANGLEGFLKSELENLSNLNGRLKAFALNKKTSQAVCLKSILRESSGDMIVACGSYQQITRESLLQMIEALDDATDLISPWRQRRVDPAFNQFQSRIFNFLVKFATGSTLNDLSCTIKVFRREVLENTELYGNMYRFLPIIASQKGFRYKEVRCEHFQERGKRGFYRLSEYLERILDILTLYFNLRFTRKPLRFFSSIGAAFFSLGVFTTLYVFYERLLMSQPIGDRIILILSIFFMVLGAQVFGVGLLGEIITFTYGRSRKAYVIETII